MGAVCLVSGLCKTDLYSRHVVSFPTEMSWQGNLAVRSSAGCLDPVSIQMKTACYIKPNSFVHLQIGSAQKSRHGKKKTLGLTLATTSFNFWLKVDSFNFKGAEMGSLKVPTYFEKDC